MLLLPSLSYTIVIINMTSLIIIAIIIIIFPVIMSYMGFPYMGVSEKLVCL